ncbi:serine/threonine-protein phosphatase [Mycolicibacterium sp. P9-64]|uniref:PP2C family protein-serine/threonine phosphatase n=1 Tax=Mycolicibacterium sp. P9-64 TaxID=2024612 RepID=UPI0011EC90FC|nr:protein phosphatase 2C domain-containing protein [Mycolicibacterium sp. P9-64]KAA0079156.1 serine/threonine-protein phosphatase [Mycolicibacterium sp. P9-64]
MTRFTVRAFTDVGLLRKRNEDAVLVAGWQCQSHDGSLVTMHFAPAPPFVCAVADGMGGHVGGNLASRVALNAIAQLSPGWRSVDDVSASLEVVNEQVRAVGAENDLGGLGTTVAGLCFLSDQLLVFNVGDSRIYSITGGVVRQISIDDSVFDASGRPTNVITQSLGQPGPVHPHVTATPLVPGTHLLCSDGVSGMMSFDELAEAAALPDLDGCAARIIEKTRANGAEDNFSFLIVDVAMGDDS